MKQIEPLDDQLSQIQYRSLHIGGVALALVIIGCLVGIFYHQAVHYFLGAYLVAYLYVLGISLGCTAFLMIYHLTGGAWGVTLRRVLEAGMRVLPVLTVLFLPILL